MPDPRSALTPVAIGPVKLAAGLTCEERPLADLVLISAWPETEKPVFDAVGKTLETAMPDDCRTAAATDGLTVFRVAPRRLMIVSEATALLDPLRDAVPETDGAVSQQGHSRVRLRLSGPGAAALLARGAPVDLDEVVFPVGAFAQTCIHHMWVQVHRTAATPETFDIYVLRSFALSFWQWLTEAAHIATQTSRGAHSLAWQTNEHTENGEVDHVCKKPGRNHRNRP
ncbi:MAG: sarcosine oxidase subunit gamma family protein [Pseudomonadota bacterium]